MSKLEIIEKEIIEVLQSHFGYDDLEMDLDKLRIFLRDVEFQNGRFYELLNESDFTGLPTDVVYNEYLNYVKLNGFRKIMTKTSFSRFLRENYGYKTKAVYNPNTGKTGRVYVKEDYKEDCED